MAPHSLSARYRYGSRKRPFWIFIRTARTCWCWSRARLRFTRWTRDNGVLGKRLAFRTRTHGLAICVDGWRSAAERSTSFCRRRVAVERFRLRRSIAAPAMIPGRLAKAWLRSSVHEEISLTVCWPAQAQARQFRHFFLEQHGKAAISTFGFSPAQTVTRGFFKMILARPQQRST